MKKKKKEMVPKRAAFINNYCLHFNGTRAAKEAGYSPRTAYSIAHELLRIPEIASEIMRRRMAQAEKVENLSVDRIRREMAAVALSNMQQLAPMFGDGTPAEKLALLTPDQAAAVAEITVEEFRDGRSDYRHVRRTKFKLHNKNQALDLLARVHGMVKDKPETNLTGHEVVRMMLEEIDRMQRGRPIVDITAQVEILPPKGEAA